MQRQIKSLPYFVVMWVLFVAAPLYAQRLYDKAQDDKAQEAKKIAEKIVSGELFAKQLENLDKQAVEDSNTYFLLAFGAMRASVNSFILWDDVNSAVTQVKESLSVPASITETELKQIREELAAKIKTLRDTIKKMKEQVVVEKDPTLGILIERIGDLSAIEQLSLELIEGNLPGAGSDEEKTLNPNLKQAFEEIKKVLTSMDEIYTTYFNRLKEYKDEEGAVAALQVPLQEVALQALQVEEEHYKRLAAIYARREAEAGQVRFLLTYYEKKATKYKLDSQRREERINETINDVLADVAAATNSAKRAEKRREAIDLLRALYAASALVAHGSTAKDLADLREAQALHRYSISKSQVKAKAYETIVLVGTMRLALFYQAGIKPSEIAQLIFAASNAAIAPSILVK